jgi:hypothetical protein
LIKKLYSKTLVDDTIQIGEKKREKKKKLTNFTFFFHHSSQLFLSLCLAIEKKDISRYINFFFLCHGERVAPEFLLCRTRRGLIVKPITSIEKTYERGKKKNRNKKNKKTHSDIERKEHQRKCCRKFLQSRPAQSLVIIIIHIGSKKKRKKESSNDYTPLYSVPFPSLSLKDEHFRVQKKNTYMSVL